LQEALTNIWKQLTKDEDNASFISEYREKLLELYQIKYPNFKVWVEEIPGNPYGFRICIEAPTVESMELPWSVIHNEDDDDHISKTFIVRNKPM
jgi:hypothetical protein